ncbi:hypothetical protein BDY19DRAFT_1024521 [Irpex rosettiformis]|uniref:Uncharacterized protein n=1 Tax=Irpex rosettiformis TaxID=378272 RepID=A0ACB8UF87_9APHY|nr:hypothetical protein BDY19DRAFT_1024521 [Irpex rosettiformis]
MSSSFFETFIGPTFIMAIFSFILYGVFCAQIYFYWANYNDHAMLQSVVVLVGLLETTHIDLIIHPMYKYLVSWWGDLHAAQKIVPTLTVIFLIEVVHSSDLAIQAIPVTVLAVTLIACIGLALKANMTLGRRFRPTSNSSQDRSRVAKRSTRRIIMSLINLSLSTGVLLVYLNVSKHSTAFGGIALISMELYANSMLASLNARQIIVQAAGNDTKFAVELSLAPSPLQFRTQAITTTDIEDSEVIANKGPNDNVDSKDSASLRVFHAVKEVV